MADFATAADLAARWRPLTPTEEAVAAERLADASAMIRTRAPGIDARITAGTLDAAVPRLVACEMVRRAMSVADVGVASVQESAGPFSTNVSYSNAVGSIYISKAEMRLLRPRRAFTIDLQPPAEDDGDAVEIVL